MAASQNERSPLIQAALDGDIEAVQMHAKNTDINIRSTVDIGQTALHVAAKSGHLRVVQFLVKHGALLGEKDDDGNTALHLAAYNGHEEIVEILILCGADKLLRNKEGASALRLASSRGHKSTAHLLTSSVPGSSLKDKEKTTAILGECESGSPDSDQNLIESRADVNAETTALMEACESGNLDFLRKLIDLKANVNVKTTDGTTPLIKASEFGDLAITTILIDAKANVNDQKNDGATALITASKFGHADVVEILIEYKADVNIKMNDGSTALILASKVGNPNVVEILVKSNADVNAKTNDGFTALIAASKCGSISIVTTLISLNAEIDAAMCSGKTALCMAVERRHREIYHILLDKGADPKIQIKKAFSSTDDDRNMSLCDITLLHKAVRKGSVKLVKRLLHSGLDPYFRDPLFRLNAEENAHLAGNSEVALFLRKKDGGTPRAPASRPEIKSTKDEYGKLTRKVMQEEKWKDCDYYRTLMDLGDIDMHYQDEEGMTILHAAVKRNDLEIIKLLLNCGALASAVTHYGVTPLDLARSLGHKDAAFMIQDHQETFEPNRIRSEKDQEDTYYDLIRIIIDSALKSLDCMEAMRKLSALISRGVPLESPKSGYAEALHLAISYNTNSSITLLLAAGTPLYVTSDGFGVVQTAWLTPDVTTWVAVAVTRAVIHKLQAEIHSETFGENGDLVYGVEQLVKQLNGPYPWLAKFTCSDNSSESLSKALYDACEKGATLTAWWIWRTGGCFHKEIQDGKSALHVALYKSKYKTAEGAILHMEANPFIAEKNEPFPINKFPSDMMQHILKRLLLRELNILENLILNATDESKEREAKELILLLLILYTYLTSDQAMHVKKTSWQKVYLRLLNFLNEQFTKHKPSEGIEDWVGSLNEKLRDYVTNNHSAEEKKGLETENNGSKSSLLINKHNLEDTFSADILIENLESVCKSALKEENISNTSTKVPDNIIKRIDCLLTEGLKMSSERKQPLFLYLLVDIAKVNVNETLNPFCGTTPLHHAAMHNNKSAVFYLLSRGADLNKQDLQGHTPAHYAYIYGNKELGDYLDAGTEHVQSRIGLKPKDMWERYTAYLKAYGLDYDSDYDIECNTDEELLNLHLNLYKKKCLHTGIRDTVMKAKVDYTQGEPKAVRKAVKLYLRNLIQDVVREDNLFEGDIVFVGSSADDVRLISPDEYDCNVIIKNFSFYPQDGCELRLKQDYNTKEYNNLKITVIGERYDLRNILKGRNFLFTFFKIIEKCLRNIPITDSRLCLVPPAIKLTQVGINLSFLWNGETYPLLLINVDIVPTIAAPWPARLSRPLLMLATKNVYLHTVGKSEWRISFGQAESHIMRNLSNNHKNVFLACKMLVSSLKTEGWMPDTVKRRYKYWDSKQIRLPLPKGYTLKNAFFAEKEEIKDEESWKEEMILKRMCSVFRRMCKTMNTEEKEKLVPGSVYAYFGSRTQPPCVGYGAPEIYKFLAEWDASTTTEREIMPVPSKCKMYNQTYNQSSYKKTFYNTNDLEQEFWSKYQALPSPANGHCLLYSVLISVETQLGHSIGGISALIAKIETETESNENEYAEFLETSQNMNKTDITTGLYKYIYDKNYDTSFGDIVPHILANALEIQFIILEQDVETNKYYFHSAGKETHKNSVYLFKKGMHYDGVRPTET